MQPSSRRTRTPLVPIVVVGDLVVLLLAGLLAYSCAGGPRPAHAQMRPASCLIARTTTTAEGSTTVCVLSADAAAQAHYRAHADGDRTALLNDLAVTPGDVGTLTAAQLCDPSFHTGTVRSVSAKTKHLVCAQYGIAKADCNGRNFEIDHLISLELGGSNSPLNLWPQPYAPVPAAHEKDIVENWLHRQVCSGAVTLAGAQKAIATDWYAVLLTVPADQGGPTLHPETPAAPAAPPAPDASQLPTLNRTQRQAATAGVAEGAQR